MTVEKLGSMTPEELEEIQGIGPKMVEKIQLAVNAYYAQFDDPGEAGVTGEVKTAPVGEAPEAETLESAAEVVDSPDSAPAESVTMEDINSSAHSLDEKGEVHES